MNAFLKKYGALIGVLALVLICTTAYAAGYRVGPGITLDRVGTLSVASLPKGATLYVDKTAHGTATGSSTLNVDLEPGNHMLIVSASSSYPWSALVAVASGKTTVVTPLLIHTPTKVNQLSGDAQKAALAAISSTTLPTESAPIVLANGCALVSVIDNQVVATATSTPTCDEPAYLCAGGTCAATILFAPHSPLTTVLPYPGRQDTLIVGVGNVLYALGINPETPQFFAPLIEGAAPPVSGNLQDGTIVVREGASVFSLSL